MFERIKTVTQIVRIIRRGHHLGDAAALKLTLTGQHEEETAHTAEVLALREATFLDLQREQLSGAQPGSLGHAYAQFMRDNELSPLNFSEAARPWFDRYPVALRYIRTHDMIHVLLGFGTDIAGELGVYAFIGQQGYSDTLNKASRTAARVARLMFWARSRLRDAWSRGQALAKGAKIPITAPLESWLELPLSEVRQRLGLEAAGAPDTQAIGGH